MLRKTFHWFTAPNLLPLKVALLMALVIAVIVLAYYLVGAATFLLGPSGEQFVLWTLGNEAERESLIISQPDVCPGAPFILPADGFVGLPYASSGGPYTRANPHQGIDIFSPDRNTPGLVPVYAAYDGYISRENDWRSSLIQRVPNDPLQPGRQLWLYYTHMADTDGNDFIADLFPAGSSEIFVEQGTLLGYTGNYNGNSPRGIWVHLHFSIVKDSGEGSYLNELEFENTLDPSPYLGMAVSAACTSSISGCGPIEGCAQSN